MPTINNYSIIIFGAPSSMAPLCHTLDFNSSSSTIVWLIHLCIQVLRSIMTVFQSVQTTLRHTGLFEKCSTIKVLINRLRTVCIRVTLYLLIVFSVNTSHSNRTKRVIIHAAAAEKIWNRWNFRCNCFARPHLIKVWKTRESCKPMRWNRVLRSVC